MAEDDEPKAAPLVSGAELEVMLTEWDTPLVVDAYATWYVILPRMMVPTPAFSFSCSLVFVSRVCWSPAKCSLVVNSRRTGTDIELSLKGADPAC